MDDIDPDLIPLVEAGDIATLARMASELMDEYSRQLEEIRLHQYSIARHLRRLAREAEFGDD